MTTGSIVAAIAPSDYYAVIVAKARALGVKDPKFASYCEAMQPINMTMVLAALPTKKQKHGDKVIDIIEELNET